MKAPKQLPRTLERAREADVTFIDQDDEEVLADEEQDEFKDYFGGKQPKLLITTGTHESVVCIPFSALPFQFVLKGGTLTYECSSFLQTL